MRVLVAIGALLLLLPLLGGCGGGDEAATELRPPPPSATNKVRVYFVREGKVWAGAAGTGFRGTFEFVAPFEVDFDGVGSLIVFENSAKDGSRINLVEIPLRMKE